jgi:hypothetical protein
MGKTDSAHDHKINVCGHTDELREVLDVLISQVISNCMGLEDLMDKNINITAFIRRQ